MLIARVQGRRSKRRQAQGTQQRSATLEYSAEQTRTCSWNRARPLTCSYGATFPGAKAEAPRSQECEDKDQHLGVESSLKTRLLRALCWPSAWAYCTKQCTMKSVSTAAALNFWAPRCGNEMLCAKRCSCHCTSATRLIKPKS